MNSLLMAIPNISVNIGGADNPTEVTATLQILLFITVIALAPSILIMMTSFTRIIVMLHFMRAAMATQQTPPNQVLVGLALFLTLFLMAPIFTEINENAVKPYTSGLISTEEALSTGMRPLRKFMRDQAEDRDVAMFIELSGETFATQADVPDRILIPAFVLGELTKGFRMGFIIYIPFIVIDMVVASVLMAMGMMMLPPAMISMPFKVLMFVLSGGWSFFIESFMRSFRM